MEWHMKGENIGKIITAQYDLVCNGLEAGGGSIRAHQPEVLKQTYRIMGYTDEEIEEGIGHMLEAFEFGAPPHGGIGMGIDRHIMLLAGEDSLKEAIAFPMTSTGKTSIMDAPSAIPQEDLETLHIQVSDKGDEVIGKIRSMLDSAGAKYKFLEHQEVRTSEEAAKVRGTKISDGAKAMVLKSLDYEGKYVMVVVPADKQVDLAKVAGVLGEKFEVANGKEVESYTGIKMGGVPPFGRLLKMEVYFDKSMWSKTESAFNCGRKDRSIIMKTHDLIKLSAPNKISESSDFVS
jgi:prolyl-tRNA editing enzyme YbaK/EbsC (Cys-tRNA(Pro) deacylase)